MEAFQIIQPSPLLAPYVKQYWFLKSECAGHIQGIVPTGYINLYIHRAESLFSIYKNETLPQMHITGQFMHYENLLLADNTDMICIDFLPHGAKMFFGIPIHELKEKTIALDLLNDPGITELGKQLSDTFNNELCVQKIEQFLMKRFSLIENYDFKRIAETVIAINKGQTDINKLSEVSCLSYKQFKRIFSKYVGANPKDFLRIIRFQRTLYTLQTQPQINFTELAFECGYYDQPHLIKEFKSFSGYTPGEYLSVYKPYSDYFS